MAKTEFLIRTLDLSKREVQMLWHAAKGDTVRETALELHLAPGTVKNQRQAAIRKLKARSLAHAVAIAIRAGIIR